jgi:recombination protein RecA
MTKTWDLFISHASEDKATVARPLADLLARLGLRVWYDEFSLSLGDSLRRKIDHGLAESRFGLVILSKSFFAKEWPQRELDGLVAREIEGSKVILPLWHGVTRADVSRFSPPLADKLAANTDLGLEAIAAQIAEAVREAVDLVPESKRSASPTSPSRRPASRRPQRSGGTTQSRNAPAISTGSSFLDFALGTGGWPIGFVSQIYGPSGAGKTSLALAAIRQCQLSGKTAAYIDADRAQTATTLDRFGVNRSDLLLSSPTTLDEVVEITLALVGSKKVGLVVVDTIASLPCKSLLNSDTEEMLSEPHLQRQLMFRFAEHLGSIARDGKAAVLILNRVMHKVGVMFGNPEDIPWFTAPLKDLFSLVVDVRLMGVVKSGERAVGFEMNAKCVKNRLAVPYRAARFSIDYRKGIMDLDSIINYAASNGLLKKRQRAYVFDGEPIGHSLAAVAVACETNQVLLSRLREAVLLDFEAS